MREIRYRFYDKIRKRMCIVASLEWKKNGGMQAYCKEGIGGKVAGPSISALMQYTGTKEIYEGDICQCPTHESDEIFKGVVEYCEDMGQWFVVCEEDGESEPLWEFSFEVIGNIHSNPELL